MLVFVSPAVLAKGSELKFKAAIAEINQRAEGVSTVIVSLFSESTDFDITVIVDANTKIESNGNEIDLSELEIGGYIKVSAFFSEAGIVAEEIDFLDGRLGQFRMLGQRREGHVEFDGVITQSDSNFLSVETHNGTILSVVIDGDTKIRGDLSVGVYAEVDGFLNEQLQVVADKIKVDGDGNGDAGDNDRRDKRGHDDDDEDESEVVREVSFQNIDANSGIEGKEKFKHELEDNDIEQELEIEHTAANTTYGIGVEFGERRC